MRRPEPSLFPHEPATPIPGAVKRRTSASRPQRAPFSPQSSQYEYSHDAPDALFAQIVLDRGQSSLDRELTYAIPPEMRDVLRVGFAVLVPVARQYLTGYVVGFTQSLDFDAKQLRPINRLLSRVPLFDEKSLQVARWMSAYYHCALADCLCCYVPQGSQQATEKRYIFAAEHWEEALRPLSRSPKQLQVAQLLLKSEKPLSLREIEKHAGEVRAALKKLVEAGVISEDDELLDPTVKPRRVQAVRLTDETFLQEEPWQSLRKNATKQALALKKLLELHNDGDASTRQAIPTLQLARDFGIELGALRGLEQRGYLKFSTVEISRDPTPHLPPRDTQFVQLTEEQQNAIGVIENALEVQGRNAIDRVSSEPETRNPKPEVVLLQGVTASGKTEVYLNAIEKCLQLGRRALVLVPEIALTAQTVEIFQRRFQERVAILHSALGVGERFDEWRRARAGRADIVVGARSAVFAPCRNVGLIIIDEEHDNSYKQDSLPRYHARDVAIKRATLDGAVVVLGSATPSLESFHRAQRGEYSHVVMKNRVTGRTLPEVEVVDMTEEAKMGTLPVLSTRMKDALCETVARGEQAILFLNRRGFAVYVQCLGCGHVERCPNCDVALTFHKGEKSLRCHHCDHATPVIETCPKCDGWMIGFSGTGTEKVESEVSYLLQQRGLASTQILRLDRDTTSRKGAHGKILGEFRQKKAQILIGTQMVTKGLDFPDVTLVGVIAADSALNMPDFRASERTFQLLAQVSGRAGRGDRPGKVVVQSLDPAHYAIEAAKAQNFETFVQQELEFRSSPPYPPFAHVVNIISQDEEEGKAKARLDVLALKFAEAIRLEGETNRPTEILGPVSCPLGRVKNKFRFHLMLRDRNRPRLHRVLKPYDDLTRDQKTGLIIDVDASSLL